MELNLFTVVALVFVPLLVFKLWKIVKYCCAVFRDYYVLWNIAFGAHPTRRNLIHPMRIHPYVCNPKLLDNWSIEELFAFGKSMVSSDISLETFHKIVVSYQFVIVFRERLDGSLRGMCLLGKDSFYHKGKPITTIKLGLALFHSSYQGGPYLYYVILYHVIRELIFSPRTPVYILTKLYSYKSYLALVNTCNNVYPVYNRKCPEFERSLLNDFAQSIRFPDESYDEDTFVLKRELSYVKSHVAPLTERDLQNPHIAFFTQQNSGWTKGHCMFSIAEVNWHAVFKAVKKSIGRAFRGRSRDLIDAKSNKARKCFDRHLSFNCAEAKIEALEKYTIRDGHVAMRNRGSEDIYVSENENTPEETQ